MTNGSDNVNPEILDIHKIREILPHRYPFLLIDRVVEYTVGERLIALKNVTINEPFFQGHYPSYPVMPGVLIMEIMAQSCAILASLGLGATADEKYVYLFAGADKVRFRRPVEPGDQLMIEATMIKERRGMWKCGANATVDGEAAANAEILFTYREA